MSLIKTSLLNGIAVVIRMLTLLGLNKVLAVYVGPSGYAALGQFQNAIQIITKFSSGAINTGVIKYTAEYYEDEDRQRIVWGTAGTIALIGSFVAGLLVAFFNRPLARYFLKDEALGSVFLWFAATLVLFVFNALLLAILNGKKEIPRYVTANIAGSLFALAVTSVMAMRFGLYGALVSLAIYQSLTFFVTLILTCQASWFRASYLLGAIDKQVAKNLVKFTAMALTSAVCMPVSQILIRNHLGETLGWVEAGYWEAMWRLSAAYLMLVTTTLTVYYLPRLSELKTIAEIRLEIIQGYKIILPVAVACSLVVYLLRDFIIKVLFSADFLPMEQLFSFQLFGDALKIACFILGYVVVAKEMTVFFIVKEFFISVLFVLMSMLFVNQKGLHGVVVAYVITYALNFFLLYIYCFRGRCGQ